MAQILGHIDLNQKREREMLLDMIADIQEMIQPAGIFIVVVDTQQGVTVVFSKGMIKSRDARIYLQNQSINVARRARRGQ